jgi:predicted GH43/DUF377 family glycosyl hydrolase
VTAIKWEKLGRVFCPENNSAWMRTHAASPVAEHIGGDRFRVYFSCRDNINRSSIGYVEIDITRPDRILNLSADPVVSPGSAGLFDDSGASMGCIVQHGGKRYLYYLGWNLGVTVPWRNSIGLAISDGPDGKFVKYSQAPIMDRSQADPYSISYPWIVRDERRWRMWYGSNLSWGPNQADMAHSIKYAESEDGIGWEREGAVAIGFKSPDEYAISKPCVVKDGALFRMWYSFRGKAYRIGYAESVDGLHWTRLDEEAAIEVSASGWDSESIEYPCVFHHRGRAYMLYNGNGYGATGFGLAVG